MHSPVIPPTPPSEPGLSWQHPTPDDADALARHTIRVDRAETLEHVVGADFLRWMMDQHDFDPETEWLIGVDPLGEVMAEAGAWTQITHKGGRGFVWFETSPGWEPLKPFLLSWGEAVSRRRLEATPKGASRTLRCPVEEHRNAHRAVVEEAGWTAERSFVLMTRLLESPFTPTPAPAGVEVVGWSADLDNSVRLANNAAFADHWGSLPMESEAWQDMYSRSDQFRPDLSYLAVDDGRVVSFCLIEIDEENNHLRGVREAYVNHVGTLREYRGRGVATHLIERSLQASAAVGMDRAALDVDETSHTNATEVYRRLGFSVSLRSIHYVKHP